MAVGTVSGVDQQDNWQLIASQAASGLSTYTFSSLSGYKTYWLVGKAMTSATGQHIQVLINGDTSSASYANGWAVNDGQSGFLLATNVTTSRAFSFQIDNAEKTIPHQVRANTYNGTFPATPGDAYTDPVVITSLTLKTLSGGNFTGGTIYLYGIAA
jgi:hypothetical protein